MTLEEYAQQIQDLKDALLKNPQQSTCPCCGYCPHCGRGGYHTRPYYQPYFQPYYTPTWPYRGQTIYMNSSGGAQ